LTRRSAGQVLAPIAKTRLSSLRKPRAGIREM